MKNFFIMGHNPNELSQVAEVLSAGGNALEPDIQHHKDGNFYVHEELPLINLIEPSGMLLTDYLDGLRGLINQHPGWKLGLITFDLKPPFNYDINKLYAVIRNNFSRYFPEVLIFTTTGSSKGEDFLSTHTEQLGNEFAGVDEGANADDLNTYFKAKSLKHIYANGSSLLNCTLPEYSNQVKEAVRLRDMGGNFHYVYAWTANAEHSMRHYLDMGVDGLITDKPSSLVELINRDYAHQYTVVDLKGGV
jgi:hypothetical protein